MSTTSVAVLEQEWTSLEWQERELEARVKRLRQWYNNWQGQSIASSLSRQKATNEAFAEHIQWLLGIARGVYEHRLEGIRLYGKDSGDATQMEDKAYLFMCTITGLVLAQRVSLAQAEDPGLRQAVMDALFCPHSEINKVFALIGQEADELERDSQKIARDRREFKKGLRRHLQQEEGSLRQLQGKITDWASQDEAHAAYLEPICPARAQAARETIRRREIHAGKRSLASCYSPTQPAQKRRREAAKLTSEKRLPVGSLPQGWDIFVEVDRDGFKRKTVSLVEAVNPLGLLRNLLRPCNLERVHPEQVMRMLQDICALSLHERRSFPATDIPGFVGWREYLTKVENFRLLVKVKEAKHKLDKPALTLFLYRQW